MIPFFGYAKGDKKDEPRVSIRARVCADCIEAAGADRVLTMDLHSPQIQGFFKIPVDHLYAMPVLVDYFREKEIPDLVVASPDVGFGKQAYKFAEMMRASVVFGNKVRHEHDEKAEMLDIIGAFEGKNVLIVDDFTISGGTLIEMAIACKERGCKDIYSCVSHGVFSRGSAAKIAQSPIKELVLTDTIGYRERDTPALLQGRHRRQPLRRRHPLDPPPREREPALQLLTIAVSCGEDGRVAEALIRDRDRPGARNRLRDETGRNMARGHLDEEFHAEFVHDFQGVVPADRMRDAGCKVPADGFGVRERAAAAIAHIGH